jgi:DNA adenine methylase/adenine-specific DNA-methyltransferase
MSGQPSEHRMTTALQLTLPGTPEAPSSMPAKVRGLPPLRFMGSKQRLLPWLFDVLHRLDFETVLDAFSGSGAVAYLLKAMDRTVTANDTLNFSCMIARATVENNGVRLSERDLVLLLRERPDADQFIENTFNGIFFSRADLAFLDQIWANLRTFRDPYRKALALTALTRSCVKRQPRGVFTVAGDPAKYKDGRRDLKLSLKDHFLENVHLYGEIVFDNGRRNVALRGDVFEVPDTGFDLVYMDPPYVPRSDDNCYIKRYHFLEGLSYYWRGAELLEGSKVKKLKKPFTPFSYRRTAIPTFERLFSQFRRSTLVLSYSSNGFPDLECLVALMEGVGKRVEVHERPHRYHFGTHARVKRSVVTEYLIVGR